MSLSTIIKQASKTKLEAPQNNPTSLFSYEENEVFLAELLSTEQKKFINFFRVDTKPNTEGALSGCVYVSYSKVKDIDNLDASGMGWTLYVSILEKVVNVARACGHSAHINVGASLNFPIIEAIIGAERVERAEARELARSNYQQRMANRQQTVVQTMVNNDTGEVSESPV